MGIKLLFADDSVTMQKVIQLTLENEDVDLQVAGDGTTAYAMAQAEVPDLVIADVSMPGLDGYQLCEKLKGDPRTGGIPVILISGELEQYDEKRGQAAGAAAHVTKPFKSGEFIDTIRKIVAQGAGPSAKKAAAPKRKQEAVEVSATEPEVLELITKSKGAADADGDEEIEIVDEDIDDLTGDLDDEEPLLEEDLLSPEDEGDLEEEVLEEPALKDAEKLMGEDEILQEEESALPPVFETRKGGAMPSALDAHEEVVREVGHDEIPEGFDIFGAEGVSTEFERREARKSEEAEKILADVFGGNEPVAEEPDVAHTSEKEEPPVEDATMGEEELWNKTLEELNDEMAAAAPAPPVKEAPAVDTIFVPPPAAKGKQMPVAATAEAAAMPAGQMDQAFRQAVERAVADFIATQAPGIFREEMSKAIDRHVKEIFETQMEKAFREEISKMIAASFQETMPRMLLIIEKITTQITPKIAQHMIKIAIERIKKGEIN